MEPSEKYIKEFQEIYKKEHGKELTWEEAADGAHNLLNLARIVYC